MTDQGTRGPPSSSLPPIIVSLVGRLRVASACNFSLATYMQSNWVLCRNEAVGYLPQALVQYHVLHRVGDGSSCSVVHLIASFDQVLLYTVECVPQGIRFVCVSSWV